MKVVFTQEGKEQYVENGIAFLLASVVSFFFLLKSPLHPWGGSDARTDSSVFKTVALMMEKGYMPYKDSFDHKGPLLYIINWLGNKVSLYRGVWIIEFLFMIITVFVLYRIARLVCQQWEAVIIVFMSFSLLFVYFEGGNLSEEYAMVFISVALFIFLDYFRNNKISKLRLIICGACLGGTLLLRPNMVATWVVMCSVIFMKVIINKDWEALRKFTGWFIVGMTIIVLPIIVWLGINNSLECFWRAYIIFNEKYASTASFLAKWNSFVAFFDSPVCIISFSALVFVGIIKERFLAIVYILYMLITLLLICMSGMTYGHYGMVLVPAMVYPLALLFSAIENIENKSISRIILICVSIYFFKALILPDWIVLAKSIPAIYATRDENHREEVTETVSTIIVNNTKNDEAISVYGNWDIIYVLSKRRHATKYSYQFPIGQIAPEIMNEYINQLQDELPPLIVVQSGHYDDTITKFLNKNQYQLCWAENSDEVTGALIYVR